MGEGQYIEFAFKGFHDAMLNHSSRTFILLKQELHINYDLNMRSLIIVSLQFTVPIITNNDNLVVIKNRPLPLLIFSSYLQIIALLIQKYVVLNY